MKYGIYKSPQVVQSQWPLLEDLRVFGFNRMRRQLGKDFGNRAIYGTRKIGSNNYMPFSKKGLRQLKKGNVPNLHLKF